MYFTFTYVGRQGVSSSPIASAGQKILQEAHRPPRIRFITSIAISFLNA